MTIEIIDASVAVKWFVDGEGGASGALAILDRIEANPREFAVPELFFNEILAVLCRRIREEARVRRTLEILQNLGWRRLGNGSELLAAAVNLAKERGLSGYDAIYAACAKLTGGVWLTADERAHKKITSLRISRFVA